MENQHRQESIPRRILTRAGLALGALTLGFMVTPEGPLSTGDIWVGGYDTPVEGSAETVDRMSIATYNVKNGHIDREGIVETVRVMDADIVGLNEVSPKLAMELAGSHYSYRFAPTLQTESGPYGNALLVNKDYEILSHKNMELPDGGHEPRAVLYVEVDVGDEVLNVFVTHLSPSGWRDSQSSLRYDQAVVLMDAVEDFGPENTVVLGDLNEESGPAYNYIAARLSDGAHRAGIGDTSTFSNGYDKKRLDHIMLSAESFDPVGGGRSGSGASDHEVLGILVLAASGS